MHAAMSDPDPRWPHDVRNNHQGVARVKRLAPLAGDPDVMDLLCSMALDAVDGKIRNALIDVLGANAEEACRRFVDTVLNDPEPTRRQSALVNLYRLACRQAKQAVIIGLDDPDASVRQAAAMNVGLYDDKDVANAFERYLERTGCAWSLASSRLSGERRRKIPTPLTMKMSAVVVSDSQFFARHKRVRGVGWLSTASRHGADGPNNPHR